MGVQAALGEQAAWPAPVGFLGEFLVWKIRAGALSPARVHAIGRAFPGSADVAVLPAATMPAATHSWNRYDGYTLSTAAPFVSPLKVSAAMAMVQGSSLPLRCEGDISGQDSVHALSAGLRMIW